METEYSDFYLEALGLGNARLDFLVAANKIEPSILDDLHHDILPIFQKYSGRKDLFSPGNRFDYIVTMTVGNELRSATIHDRAELTMWKDLKSCSKARRLERVLSSWAKNHNLLTKSKSKIQCVDWIMDTALQTLHHWNNDEIPNQLGWAQNIIPVASVTSEEKLLSFKDDGWDPAKEHWSNFQKRIKSEFSSLLKDYRIRLSTLASKRGLKKTPRKHKTLHYEWLAQHRVKRLSYLEIAREYWVKDIPDPDRKKTVRDAIIATEELLGL